MKTLDKSAILGASPVVMARRFVDIRDPLSGKLLLRFSSATQEIEIKHKNEAPKIINLRTLEVTPS